MRILDENDNEIRESDIDLEKGKMFQTAIIKPGAKPVDDVTKFAYDDDDYEMVIRYIRIPDKEIISGKITELKKNLMDTDYCIMKVVEGAATLIDYAETIAKRKSWRKEINDLEAELNAMEL